MENKFTPGKWTPGAGKAIGLQIIGVWAGDYKVVAICGKQKEPDEKESIANAYLVAAAPDMYEALESLEKWWRLPSAERTIEAIEPVVREALAAIAKAEGRE